MVAPRFTGVGSFMRLPQINDMEGVDAAVVGIPFDTGDSYWGERYTHGTWCKRAIEEGLIDTKRAVQLGIRGSLYGSEDRGGARALGLHLIPTEELLKRGVDDVLLEVRRRIGDGPVFLTFDIDFVDPGFAPGTGTPEVGGPSSRDALRLVRGLRGIEFVGFDLV